MFFQALPLAVNLSDPTTEGLLFLGVIAVVLAEIFVGRGIFLIKDNQVGVLIKKFGGQRMPEGQIIARKGQIGVQARTLMPGLYWRFPLFWSNRKFPITEIDTDKIGIVEAIDGEPLQKGRILGDEVNCNKFQDGEAFLDLHGKKGQQVGLLTTGNYRINPLLFRVQVKDATIIGSESTGIVTAEDGIPLPSELIIAPQPLKAPDSENQFPTARDHKHFQDGQGFIDSGGYRGPQLDTLQPGKYFINDLLFKVQILDKYEVRPGFVAVLRSNVGRDLVKSTRVPVPVTDASSQQTPEAQLASQGSDMKETISSDIESVLISDKLQRGIYDQPLAPGTYNLNTIAYTAYEVPTSAIMIDWADSISLSTPTMSGPAATAAQTTTKPVTKANVATYPYTTDASTKGISYFNFSQLEVISSDGFQLEVGVRMVIRIRQENAAFVIARFGTIFNLIQQIVHPLIDSSFRNDAGSKKALEFFQSRTQLQQYVFANAKINFGMYHVEAQQLLISFIRPADESGQNLLNTQNLKEIALQQQTQYKEQANAEQQRIAVQEQMARANMQPQVVNALLQIDIERNKAEAVRRQSEGLRDFKINTAQGEAEAIRRVGEAQADAYHAQAEILGGDKVALVKIMDEIRNTTTKIVPDTLVMSGAQGQDVSSPLITAWFAKALSTPSPAMAPYVKTSPQGGTQSQPPTGTKLSESDMSAVSSMMNQSVLNTIPGAPDIGKVVPISLQNQSGSEPDSSQVDKKTGKEKPSVQNAVYSSSSDNV